MNPEDINHLLEQGQEQSDSLKEIAVSVEQQLVQNEEVSTKLSNLSQDNEHFLEQGEELKSTMESVAQAIRDIPPVVIPEAKEPLQEISVKNFPDVQKVEITNPPTEKDDAKQIELLEGILEEVKKKEEYDYDIEITPELKKQLKGEPGEPGAPGLPGAPGKPGEPGKNADPTDFSTIKIDYKQVVGGPDVEAILQKHKQSSKTVSLSELDDVNISTLTRDAQGKYILSPGGGSSSATIVSITSSTILSDLSGEFLILCDCTAGAINLTLPDPTTSRAEYHITKIDSSVNPINLIGTVNGRTDLSIGFQNTCLSLLSAGTNWRVV